MQTRAWFDALRLPSTSSLLGWYVLVGSGKCFSIFRSVKKLSGREFINSDSSLPIVSGGKIPMTDPCVVYFPIFGWSLKRHTTNSHLVKPTSFKPTESPMHHPEKWHAMQLFTQQKPIDQKVMKQYVASEIPWTCWKMFSQTMYKTNRTLFLCICVVCFTPVWRPFQNKVRPPKTSCLLPLPVRSQVFIWSKFIEQIPEIIPGTTRFPQPEWPSDT